MPHFLRTPIMSLGTRKTVGFVLASCADELRGFDASLKAAADNQLVDVIHPPLSNDHRCLSNGNGIIADYIRLDPLLCYRIAKISAGGERVIPLVGNTAIIDREIDPHIWFQVSHTPSLYPLQLPLSDIATSYKRSWDDCLQDIAISFQAPGKPLDRRRHAKHAILPHPSSANRHPYVGL